MLYILILAAAPPAAAVQPQHTIYIVKVDFVVVNTVRRTSTVYDAWGRPRYTASSTIWISFYDRLPTFIPVGWINRGWWAANQLRSCVPCTEGWAFESKNNMLIIAQQIVFIDSTYDWEMRNRYIYLPIRIP